MAVDTVMPLVARYSSGMLTNFTTPRSGRTPRAEVMKDCMRAALRLFAGGRSCEGRAVMVRIYAESKELAKRRQAECSRVIKIEDVGLWYRWDRCWDSSFRRRNSSLTCQSRAKRMGAMIHIR